MFARYCVRYKPFTAAKFSLSRFQSTSSIMKDYVFETSPKANPDAIVKGPNYRFTILTDRLFRYEWSEDGKFEDRASTFAINRNLPVPEFRTIDNEGQLEIIGEHFHIYYDKKRFSASGLSANFDSVKLTLWGSQWHYGKPAVENLGGTARTLDEIDGRVDMGQGIMSKAGYAALDDSKSMLFDGEGFVAGRRDVDHIDGYMFCYGRDYKQCLKAYYQISGKQPVLPRYALGNWWSRYYAYKQDEYIKLMDRFRKEEIPLSVAVIDMDWHLVSDDKVPHTGWTGYTWDEKLFPDPEAFGRELHSRNLKITLNDHPHHGIHHHEDSYEEMAEFMRHDTSLQAPIRFDITNPTFMEAYLKILHRNVEKVACDFWWIDWQQGEHSKIPGVDPLWMLNHFHYLDNTVHGQKPLIFSRFAGPGSQRYPVGFSGDSVISWASLEFQPEFTNTASNIGYGWWSHDIGGHMLGHRDDELVSRWVQYGVFSPIMRLHSSDSAWTSKEPWRYRKEHEVSMVKFLQFRHKLVPFLYTRNIMGASEDEPIVQPMYWSWPYHEEAYTVPNQYMFGFELMVCPIVKPRDKRTNLASVKAWLPPLHRHVDIFTGTVYDGDRTVNLYRSLEDYPVLAHEGSIIPLDADFAPKNGCTNPERFEVLVVVGRNGQASVLEDPVDDDEQVKKESPSSGERGSLIQYKQAEGQLTAHVTGRTWSFRFLAVTSVPKELKITVDGEDVTKSAEVTIDLYPNTPSMLVKVPHSPAEKSTITIDLGPDPQLSIIDHRERLEDLMVTLQTAFAVKDKIWNIITDEKSAINIKISRLLALDLDEALIGPVAELFLADSRAMHL